MARPILHSIPPNKPGASILRAPGPSSKQDPWRINKFDNSTNKKARREEEYAISEIETRLALETIDEADEERQADLEEQIRKRFLRYEDLPGTPKKFNMFLKMQDVASHRNIDCEYYSDCLGYAAFHNWPSFICTGCKHALYLR